MNNAAVRDSSEFCDDVPINIALHFYGADHIACLAAVEPHIHPFKQSFWVADYIAEHPVKFAKLFWSKCKRIVRFERNQRILHKFRNKFGTVYRKNSCA